MAIFPVVALEFVESKDVVESLNNDIYGLAVVLVCIVAVYQKLLGEFILSLIPVAAAAALYTIHALKAYFFHAIIGI
jgi:hypothetical protein